MKLRWLPAYVPSVIVLLLVLYLTLFPKPLGDEEISLFEGADKVVHFIMFGGLTGTFIFDRWRIDRPLSLKNALITALVTAMLGALIEYLQWAMQLGRAGNDLHDAIANTLGAFAAVPICRWLHWVDIIIDRRT